MEQFIEQDDDKNEVRLFDLSTTTIYSFRELKSDAFKVCVAERPACVTSFTGYAGVEFPKYARLAIARIVQRYLDGDISLRSAQYQVVLELNIQGSGSSRQASNTIRGVDVNLNKKNFDVVPPVPSNVVFNTCIDGTDPKPVDDDEGEKYFEYATILHEAGHALGLSNVDYPITGTQPDTASHPTIPTSVMNYDEDARDRFPGWPNAGYEEPDCYPHPFDLMAIRALYEFVPKDP